MKQNVSPHIFQCSVNGTSISINPHTGWVKNHKDSTRLGPVNMQVFVTLLEVAGVVVSRSELFQSVWKNQIVSDDTLTRCISELRAQLKTFPELDKSIETIPKRGYRWRHPVIKINSPSLNPLTTQNSENHSISSKWKRYLIVSVTGIILLFLLSTSVLWITERIIRPDLTRVALLPIHTQKEVDVSIAEKIDDAIRAQLISSKNIRVLSKSAIENRPTNPFPYLMHQFGTRWVIEGNIRSVGNKLRISLDLVDAKTALVSFSLTKDIVYNTDELKIFLRTFVDEMSRISGLQ